MTAPMILPISLREVAPVCAIAASMSAMTSSSPSCSATASTSSVVAPVHRATVQGGVLVRGGLLDAPAPLACGPSGLLDEYLCG